MPKLHIFKNEKETCQAFADWLVALVEEKLPAKGKFSIVLSAGDTPKQLYKLLSADYISKFDWSRIHLFWGDEKLMGPDERETNNSAVKSFIEQVNIPAENLHFIPSNLPPEESAAQYEKDLRDYFKDQEQTFDLAIMGMTEEGSILSLFPGNDENTSRDSWVIPVYNNEQELFYVTVTTGLINSAAAKAFIITGKKKEEVVQKVLNGKYDPEKYPAQLIQTANKTVHWFIDESAAAKIIKPAQ